MDLSLEELEHKVEELIKYEENNPPQNMVDLITDKTGYSKQFVGYVIETVSLHYNNPKILEHMVKFVANKCEQLDPPINIGSAAIPLPIFSKQIAPICKDLKGDSAFGFDADDGDDGSDPVREFPLLTRFAICATYCASYNPQITDKRFFFKGRDILRRKARLGPPPKALREKCHEQGPRSFEHQRAMFIFLYFCKNFDENFENHNGADLQIDFTSQITNLVDVGLLKIVSAQENLDMPMYTSLCNLEFVKQVAKSISDEFDLERDYLYDFAYDD